MGLKHHRQQRKGQQHQQLRRGTNQLDAPTVKRCLAGAAEEQTGAEPEVAMHPLTVRALAAAALPVEGWAS